MKLISMLEFPLTAAFGVYLGLCKKCRRTPILFTPVPPPTKFTFLPRGTVPRRRDSVAAPGGEVDLYARVSSHRSDWRTFGLHLGLCKKCRQTPIFTLLGFPPTLRGGTREVPSREQALRAAARWRRLHRRREVEREGTGVGRVPRERAPNPLWF